VKAIESVNTTAYDALILTRGGGSFEELMAFNDERLVRALYASKIPTLVGIGHERDLTLAEEVADVRGSTPTDCARRLVPDRKELLYTVANLQQRIAEAVDEVLVGRERLIDERLLSADRWLQGVRQKFEVIAPRVTEMEERWQASLNERIDSYLRLLASFDPTAVVRRGFAIVRDATGAVMTSAQGVKPGERLTVGLRDGNVKTIVEAIQDSVIPAKAGIQPGFPFSRE
jgi:exodeoxyribonuclease VII large subunit